MVLSLLGAKVLRSESSCYRLYYWNSLICVKLHMSYFTVSKIVNVKKYVLYGYICTSVQQA